MERAVGVQWGRHASRAIPLGDQRDHTSTTRCETTVSDALTDHKGQLTGSAPAPGVTVGAPQRQGLDWSDERKFVRVACAIAEKITKGEWIPANFPMQWQLMAWFDVAEATVMRSLRLLADLGWMHEVTVHDAPPQQRCARWLPRLTTDQGVKQIALAGQLAVKIARRLSTQATRPLPTIKVLARQYRASPFTTKQALDILADASLLERLPHRTGTPAYRLPRLVTMPTAPTRPLMTGPIRRRPVFPGEDYREKWLADLAEFINTFLDNLTSEPADETLLFSLDEASYAINVTARRADAVRTHLAPYIAAARGVHGRPPTADNLRPKGAATHA